MMLSRAFRSAAVCRPPVSGAKLARGANVQLPRDVRGLSAYAALVASRHQSARESIHREDQLSSANVELEHGLPSLRFHECSSHGSVLELELEEISEALETFLHRRAQAGLSDSEDAIKAMSDQLADRASVLYMPELDLAKVQACPNLMAIFRRLGERGVVVLSAPSPVPERRTVGSLFTAP
jgi:hypothetical protein